MVYYCAKAGDVRRLDAYRDEQGAVGTHAVAVGHSSAMASPHRQDEVDDRHEFRRSIPGIALVYDVDLIKTDTSKKLEAGMCGGRPGTDG